MKKFFKIIFLLLAVIAMSSCFQNTDFDQSQEVELRPVVELNLVHFNLNANSFYDTIANSQILTVRDTTDIDILNGSDIQDALQRAEFYFEFTNGIPRDFNVDFQFLTPENSLSYFTQTIVNQGQPSSPVTTLFVDAVNETQIIEITRSNKVVVSVSIPSSSATLAGSLNLRSKATYFLEID